MAKYYDPTRAMCSSYTPGAESADTASMLKKNPSKQAIVSAVFSRADELFNTYNDVLTIEQRLEAKKLVWGRSSVREFESFFFTVLSTYRSWEMTEERFESICNLISENDPSWLNRFVSSVNRRKSNAVKDFSKKGKAA